MNLHYEQRLINHGIKPTSMRILILKTITDKNDMFSLADLETMLETVDKSTIFRTLTLFHKHKLLHTVVDQSGSLKYGLCDVDCECLPEQQHVHFYCNRCRLTFCLRDTVVPLISMPQNYSMENLNYLVTGICGNCNKFATKLQ
jgi:Fur family ferric uptake transcriptional regulator